MPKQDGVIKSMRSNKAKGTKPELIVGKALYAGGIRYRKNAPDIYGKPDFSIKKYRVAIFVDGDFWHGKDWPLKKSEHKTNKEFWINKIERNIERDKEVNERLAGEGWTVIRVWESDVKKDINKVTEYIIDKINEQRFK